MEDNQMHRCKYLVLLFFITMLIFLMPSQVLAETEIIFVEENVLQVPDEVMEEIDFSTELSIQQIYEQIEWQIFALVNEERQRLGKPALQMDSTLRDISRSHSKDYGDNNHLALYPPGDIRRGHFSPNTGWPEDRLASRGYTSGVHYTALSENFAYNLGHNDPGAVAYNGWMNSPLHRDTIRDVGNNGFNYTGIGVYKASDGAYYFTQKFVTATSPLSSIVTPPSGPPPPITQYGSLRVNIEPAGARSAGAQWRLTSGPDTGWKNSGVTISNLPVGTYTVTFKTISGWDAPSNSSVKIEANKTLVGTATYSQVSGQTGSVRVNIEPAGARSAGAQWRLTSGPDTSWKNSGVTISNLPVGTYTVTFKTISGWNAPSNSTINITANQTLVGTATYSQVSGQTGSVRVNIEPAGARSAGAQWRLTSGPDTSWKNSGVTISNLPVGTYTVTFKTISGWNAPSNSTINITANQTLVGTATYSQATGTTFSDVPIGHPFFTEIEALYASGITSGYPDGTFRPSDNVTRMAMAAFLYRGLNLPNPIVTVPTFIDVPPSHPFFTEIEALAASGITTGYNDGTFRPSDNVTRMAMAAFLYRALDLNDPFSPMFIIPSFNDVWPDHIFFREIEALYASGITSGYPDGTFRPSDNVTRMAMAAFLVRGLELE